MTGIYPWTAEENGLIGCYWKKGKRKEVVMQEMKEALPQMEAEMQLLTREVLEKLELLPEEEYAGMSFWQA